MKPSDFEALIIDRFKAKIKRPLLVESSPGLGKTQITAQAAKALEVGFKAIHAPLLQPEDYGLPVIDKASGDVNFVVSKDKFPIEGADCEEEGIFLIDELSQADNSAQKILANLIQEREIHGKRLKKGWVIVATGNRQSDRAGANRILGHLGNRLTRIEMEASLDDWVEWALTNEVNPEVISFIRFRPELLSNYEPNQDINATPRAWAEGVSQVLGKIPKSLEFEVFKGDVGEGPAAEFIAFLRTYRNLPNLDNIIKDPKKEKVPTDPATIYALCGALAYKTTTVNFSKIMTYMSKIPPEYVLLYVKDASTKNPDIFHTKEYIKWASSEGADLLS